MDLGVIFRQLMLISKGNHPQRAYFLLAEYYIFARISPTTRDWDPTRLVIKLDHFMHQKYGLDMLESFRIRVQN